MALKEFSSPSLGSLEFKGGPVMGSLCFRTDAVRDHFFTERGDDRLGDDGSPL